VPPTDKGPDHFLAGDGEYRIPQTGVQVVEITEDELDALNPDPSVVYVIRQLELTEQILPKQIGNFVNFEIPDTARRIEIITELDEKDCLPNNTVNISIAPLSFHLAFNTITNVEQATISGNMPNWTFVAASALGKCPLGQHKFVLERDNRIHWLIDDEVVWSKDDFEFDMPTSVQFNNGTTSVTTILRFWI
jgi:hypothetical protein